MLRRTWDGAEQFVATVLEEKSLPLLHRLMIALRTVRKFSNAARAVWAAKVLQDPVMPEINILIAAPPTPPMPPNRSGRGQRDRKRVNADERLAVRICCAGFSQRGWRQRGRNGEVETVTAAPAWP